MNNESFQKPITSGVQNQKLTNLISPNLPFAYRNRALKRACDYRIKVKAWHFYQSALDWKTLSRMHDETDVAFFYLNDLLQYNIESYGWDFYMNHSDLHIGRHVIYVRFAGQEYTNEYVGEKYAAGIMLIMDFLEFYDEHYSKIYGPLKDPFWEEKDVDNQAELPHSRKLIKSVDAEPRMEKVTGIESNSAQAPITQVDNTRETAELNRDMDADEAANVQLTDTTIPSTSEVAVAPDTKRLFINELPVKVSSLGDRWCKFLQFQWSSAQGVDDIVAAVDLPITMLQNARCAPNTLLFDQYAYFKTDMRLKIQLNTNPGMSGMLIAGIMYNASGSTATGIRILNPSQLVQMPHVRLNAASSNTGELHVPWVFQLPVAPTRDMLLARGSYYYTLFFGVLGQLRSGAAGVSSANVTVYGTFENLQLYGQRNYREVVPRGEWIRDLTREGVEPNPGPNSIQRVLSGTKEAAGGLGDLTGSAQVGMVENMLSTLQLPDCDRPQNPKEPNTFYLQQNTSFSLGTGTNEVKLCQLLHDNTCPHPRDLVPSDEQFSSKFITSQWGRIGVFTWNVATAPNTPLYTMDVSPMQSYEISNTTYPTPLSGLGAFYGAYHGDIELRFTFMISKFHSGRVSIVYMPDALEQNFNDACYYSSVVDVQDQSEVMFKIPYQVPTLYALTKMRYREWNMRLSDRDYATNAISRPSYGVVRMTTVNQLRANPTAASEIQVMVEMRGGANFNYLLPVGTDFKSEDTTVSLIDNRVYGLEHGEEKPDEPVIAEARMDAPSIDERSKMITGKPILTPAVPTWFSSLNERYEVRDVVKRYVPVMVRPSSGLSNISDIETLRSATLAVYYVPLSPYSNSTDAGPIIRPDWQRLPDNVGFARTYQIAHERINMSTNNTISFRVPWNSPMSMLANGIDPSQAPGTQQGYSNGRVVLLFTLCAQAFGQTVVKPESIIMNFDVNAGTLSARVNNEENNFNFVDIVSYMHDGFRFFRGDINYQVDILPFNTGNGWDFATVINRALGDTANFYVFQGWPRMVSSTQYINMLASSPLTRTGSNADYYWENAASGKPKQEWVKDLTTEGIEPNPGPTMSTLRSESPHMWEYVRERLGLKNLKDFICKQWKGISAVITIAGVSTLSYAAAIALFCTCVFVMIKDLENKTQNTVKKTINTKMDLKSPESIEWMSDRALALMRLTVLVANIYNSEYMGLTLANIALLLDHFGLAKDVVKKVGEFVAKYALPSNEAEARAEKPKGRPDQKSAEYTALIASCVMAAMGFGSMRDFSAPSLLKGSSDFFRNSNNASSFFKNHMDTISELFEELRKRLGFATEAKTEDDIPANIIAWMTEVNYYCEIYNGDVAIEDPRVAKAIFDLQRSSAQFDTLFVQTETKAPPGYYQYKHKLQRMVDLLAKGGISEMVRVPPFSVWMYGKPGVGKTQISDQILATIGKALGVSSPHPVYTRTTVSKHWNGYRQQPLLLFPDFAKNQTCDEYRVEIDEFMSVVDTWSFNPPFAELEDKRRVVNAKALLVCSNHSFPNLTNIGMVDTQAFFRRRDLLFEAYIPAEVVMDVKRKFGVDILVQDESRDGQVPTPMASKIPHAWYKESQRELGHRYGHLRFKVHADGNKRSPIDIPFTWPQFEQYIIKKARQHQSEKSACCELQRQLYHELSPEGWEQVNALPRHIDDRVESMMENVTQAEEDAGELSGIHVNPVEEATRAGVGVEEVVGPEIHRDHIPEAEARMHPSRCDYRFVCILENENRGPPPRVIYKRLRGDEPNVTSLACGCVYKWENDVLSYWNLCTMPTDKTPMPPFDDEEIYVIGGKPYTTWDGHIPTREDLIFGISDERALNAKPNHGDIVMWNDHVLNCPHNSKVLRHGFFIEHKGKVEVAVTSSDNITYILPHQCVKGMFSYLRTSNNKQVPQNMFPFSAPRMPRFCEAERNDTKFVVQSDVLRINVRGSTLLVDDVETQVNLLNQLLTPTFLAPGNTCHTSAQAHTSVDVFMTFFFFKQQEKCGFFEKAKIAARSYAPTLFSLVSTITTYYLLYKTFKLIWNLMSTAKEIEPRAAYGGGRGSAARTKNEKVTIPVVSAAEARNQEAIVENLIATNTVTLDCNGFQIEGVRVCSTFVLCPRHFVAIGSDFTVTLNPGCENSRTFPVAFKGCKVVNFLNERGELIDMCMINIPILPASRNILGHFITRNEANAIRSMSSLIYLSPENGVFQKQQVGISLVEQQLRYSEGAMKGIVPFNGYTWAGDSNHYRCGSILISNSRIIGMFTSSTHQRQRSYAPALSRESLDEALQKLGASHFDRKLHRYSKDKSGSTSVPSSANMIPVSVLDKRIDYSGKTALEPSDITDRIPGPFLFPAEQRGDHQVPGLSVVQKGAAKQAKPVELPLQIYNIISLFFIRTILKCKPDLVGVKRPFTIQEAITGVEGDVRYSSMDLNTSLGWPFRDLVTRGWKKKHVITNNEDGVQINEILAKHYERNHDARVRGIIPDNAFMDFPKDETLKPGKDTRLINGSPIDLFIDMRRYLWQFFVAVRSEHTGIQIGMDVHSMEWGRTMAKCRDPIDEDYKNFGLTWHTQILRCIRDAAIAWSREHLEYSENELTVVHTIFEELASAYHVCGDLKYAVLCGSPSGAFGTDALNSLANLFYQMYDHYLQFGNFDRWQDEVILIYGDDLRRNKLRKHVDFKRNMADIGMIVEEDKTGKAFLKRSVNLQKLRNGRYVALAPLPPHVVIDVLHWIRKPAFCKDTALKDRLTSFIHEISHYGRVTYNRVVQQLAERLGISTHIPEFDDLMKDRYGDEFLTVEETHALRGLDLGWSVVDLSHVILDNDKEVSDKDAYDNKVREFARTQLHLCNIYDSLDDESSCEESSSTDSE